MNRLYGPRTTIGPASGDGSGTVLSAFNGTSPNGTWSLYVLDDLASDDGQIAGGWSLDITAADTAAPRLAQLNVLYAGGSFDLLANPARRVLPWQVTGVQAVFDEPVVGTLALIGLPATTAASPAVSSGGTTFTWTFGSGGNPAPVEQMAVTAAGVSGGEDAAGNDFAGATRSFGVLVGDVTGDGRVTADDLRAVQAAMGGAGNPFANLDGFGGTDSADYSIARSRLGRRL